MVIEVSWSSSDEDVDAMPEAIPRETTIGVDNRLALSNSDHDAQVTAPTLPSGLRFPGMEPGLIGPFPLRKPMTQTSITDREAVDNCCREKKYDIISEEVHHVLPHPKVALVSVLKLSPSELFLWIGLLTFT